MLPYLASGKERKAASNRRGPWGMTSAPEPTAGGHTAVWTHSRPFSVCFTYGDWLVPAVHLGKAVTLKKSLTQSFLRSSGYDRKLADVRAAA